MLIGRLGRDPELRYTQTGAPVCSLNLATDESYQDREGNKVERTEWHRVSVFQRAAENCANFLAKGSLVFVEGSLQTRKWQDQQGQDRYTTEIKAQRVQFLDRRGGEGSGPRSGPGFDGNDMGSESGGYGGGQGGGQGGYGGGRSQGGRGGAQSGGQGGQGGQGGGQGGAQSGQSRRQRDDDLGPAFPSEASGMDEVPF